MMMTTTPLQSSLHNQNASLSLSLSSSRCYSPSPLLPFKLSTQRVSVCYEGVSATVTCSISKIHNYGTVDDERGPIVNAIYKRISSMENPELGSAAVLNQWENEGKNLTKWDLRRVVKELRKFRKHHRALQIANTASKVCIIWKPIPSYYSIKWHDSFVIMKVYDWMNNRPERFRMSASDAAIQLDLVAKVHGVSSAEGFFMNLTDDLKDKRTHGALLNVYVHSRLKEKAESLLDIMRSKRYLTHSLPFSITMTLYRNLKEYDKVDMLVSEMKEKNIQLDVYTYNIWLSSCGSQGSIEKMEQVFEEMSKDPTIIPTLSTFTTMASMYIKMELFEKAEEFLKKVEGRIIGRDREPFHYLLSLYGSIGNKDEVYRVWNTYKSMFPSIPNFGYHAIISSLVRMDDIEGAEKLYEEWVLVRPSDDSRIGNLLIGWYVKNGKTDKALKFLEHMTDGGGCPDSITWGLLSEGHIANKRISEALSCLKKAFTTRGLKNWKPKPIKLSAFLEFCRDQDDMASADVLIELLRQSEHLKDEAYASLIGKGEFSRRIETADRTDDIVDSENVDDDSRELFNQL